MKEKIATFDRYNDTDHQSIFGMKKTIILSLAALILSVNAGAQVFDHLSIGLGAGTDGLGIELAAPLGNHVDIRAGYGAAVGLVGYTLHGIRLPEHPANPNSKDVPVPMKMGFGMNDARLLFNIYPSATKGFHFTVGAYMGSPAFLSGKLVNMPSDYETMGIDVDGYVVKAKNGVLATKLAAPGLGGKSFAVKPYVGIGFGRAVDRDRRVSFCFDLGVQYQGKAGLWAEGESVTGRTEKVQLTREHVEAIGDVMDEVAKYAAFWPTLSFRLNVRLF